MADENADPARLVEQLKAVIDHPDSFATHGPEIIQLSRKAAIALEGPFETFQRLAYSALPLVSARIAQQHGIFEALVYNGEEPTSVSALVDKTGLHPTVMESLLDYMSTQSMVSEVRPGQYTATKLSAMLVSSFFNDGITHFHDNCLPAFNALNQSLSNPLDPRTAFQIGQHSGPDNLYAWLESHPVQKGAFHRFMEAQFATLPSWLDLVPFESQFARGAEPHTPIFVDVGGGNGQQCEAILKRYPGIVGRIVLQDHLGVLESSTAGARVERMEYDYLTEQPVRGARVYYFRQIFHNNSDETSLRILRSHLPAMGPDSILLIDEKVLPDEKPHGATGVEYTAGLGIAMLAMFKALERKEAHWRKLLGDGGFEIRTIVRATEFGDSVIVATKM